MMICNEIQVLIEKLLNHDMTRQERQDFRKHIHNCPDCRTEFERWQKIEKELSGFPRQKCPDEVLEKIYSNTIRSEQKNIRWIRFRDFAGHAGWKWAGAAVAFGLILLFTIIHPIGDRNKIEEISYSQEEALKAREQAKWSLAYVAQIIQKSEKTAIDNALLIELPQTVRKAVKNTVPILKGGS
jgi:hypothetical protein